MKITSKNITPILLLFVGTLSILGFLPYFGFKDTDSEIEKIFKRQEFFEKNVLNLERDISSISSAQKDYLIHKDSFHLNKVGFIHKRINELLIQFEKITNDKKLSEIYSKKQKYFKTLKSLIDLEGRETTGFMGKMRNNIHILEKKYKHNKSSLITILNLRRYEKDYLLRNKTEYIAKLNIASEVLRKNIKRSDYKYLDSYLGIFIKLCDNRNTMHTVEQAWLDSQNEIEETLTEVIFEFDLKMYIDITKLKGQQQSYLSLMITIAVLNIFGIVMLMLIFKRYSQGILKLNSELEEQMILNSSFQEKLVSQERLASLGNVAAGIAHEIKNPLNFISSSTQSLTTFIQTDLPSYLEKFEKGISKDDLKYFKEDIEDLNFMCKSIQEGSSRANDIVTSMLELTGKSDQVEEVCELDKLIETALSIASKSEEIFGKPVKYNKTFHDFPKIIGYKNDLEKAFVNIITNAIYFMKQKEKLNPDYSPQLDILLEESDNEIRITFSNNGLKIDDKNINSVFEPFFTTKPTGKGTGLGMAICHDIIKRNNGTIEVSSVEDQTTFKIEINRS